MTQWEKEGVEMVCSRCFSWIGFLYNLYMNRKAQNKELEAASTDWNFILLLFFYCGVQNKTIRFFGGILLLEITCLFTLVRDRPTIYYVKAPDSCELYKGNNVLTHPIHYEIAVKDLQARHI